MNQIEKNKLKTDQAWEQLYTRLEQDGLLDKPISDTQSMMIAAAHFISPIRYGICVPG